ncbi:hypothetical protein B0J15DRAFT_98492 [Fusarium solani]|uniref:Cytochrome b5 heme-binding domain-containing protein n=1 Tax=Fusarium solani TaxID=169388 RepID=A0A9P9RBY0_FUSSL|nr:uncharacterized protein B0J15DRAFT_98492 [Fusarium solani]KAH7273382.1 hypothetical protein B0J15DRAFT_98492 [Fusarium solani]
MGVIGISLIVASVVWVLVRPPSWIPSPLQILLRWRGSPPATITDSKTDPSTADADSGSDMGPSASPGPRVLVSLDHEVEPALRTRTDPADKPVDRTTRASSSDPDRLHQPLGQGLVASSSQQSLPAKHDTASMPPPPLPKIVSQPPPPTIAEPDEQTTPKATAVSDPPSLPVPTFSLDNAPPAPSSHPAPPRNPTVRGPAPSIAAPSLGPSMMPPPPRPGRLPPMPSSATPINRVSSSTSSSSGRLPSLAQFPAANSAQRARGPAPNRGPASSGLAPPPTHSSKPSKPSRKVLLTPGHSPLDWARISGPNSDLRGVDPSTPYLRVTPSMLKVQTGRKGKDAWMALNGKVYNITPYADFHPGGVPELLRGAGRDGTKLFGEIHPWVNYETMLSACLVGLLVEESEGAESQMDGMD